MLRMLNIVYTFEAILAIYYQHIQIISGLYGFIN